MTKPKAYKLLTSIGLHRHFPHIFLLLVIMYLFAIFVWQINKLYCKINNKKRKGHNVLYLGVEDNPSETPTINLHQFPHCPLYIIMKLVRRICLKINTLHPSDQSLYSHDQCTKVS